MQLWCTIVDFTLQQPCSIPHDCEVLGMQAQQYASLRKPYLVNDMLMQDILLDRRKVYQQLQVGPVKVLPQHAPTRDTL